MSTTTKVWNIATDICTNDALRPVNEDLKVSIRMSELTRMVEIVYRAEDHVAHSNRPGAMALLKQIQDLINSCC